MGDIVRCTICKSKPVLIPGSDEYVCPNDCSYMVNKDYEIYYQHLDECKSCQKSVSDHDESIKDDVDILFHLRTCNQCQNKIMDHVHEWDCLYADDYPGD